MRTLFQMTLVSILWPICVGYTGENSPAFLRAIDQGKLLQPYAETVTKTSRAFQFHEQLTTISQSNGALNSKILTPTLLLFCKHSTNIKSAQTIFLLRFCVKISAHMYNLPSKESCKKRNYSQHPEEKKHN